MPLSWGLHSIRRDMNRIGNHSQSHNFEGYFLPLILWTNFQHYNNVFIQRLFCCGANVIIDNSEFNCQNACSVFTKVFIIKWNNLVKSFIELARWLFIVIPIFSHTQAQMFGLCIHIGVQVRYINCLCTTSWRRHHMETFSASLALCAGIHRSPVNSPHKSQWRGALMFSLICAWISSWENNREASGLRRQGAHYDVTVMFYQHVNQRRGPAHCTSAAPCKLNIRVHIDAIHCLKLILVFLVLKHHSSW